MNPSSKQQRGRRTLSHAREIWLSPAPRKEPPSRSPYDPLLSHPVSLACYVCLSRKRRWIMFPKRPRKASRKAPLRSRPKRPRKASRGAPALRSRRALQGFIKSGVCFNNDQTDISKYLITNTRTCDPCVIVFKYICDIKRYLWQST